MYKLIIIATWIISLITLGTLIVVLEEYNRTPVVVQCTYPQQSGAIDYPLFIETWEDWPAI